MSLPWGGSNHGASTGAAAPIDLGACPQPKSLRAGVKANPHSPISQGTQASKNGAGKPRYPFTGKHPKALGGGPVTTVDSPGDDYCGWTNTATV